VKRLTPHFALPEFLPRGLGENDVPIGALENLEKLCQTIMEPLREHFGSPIYITSGYRPPDKNKAVGGVSTSDHLMGRACDFYVPSVNEHGWIDNTFEAFHWLRKFKLDYIGQLILEDRRFHSGRPSNLCVHVSIPSPKHPGRGDVNQLLVSYKQGVYEPWRESVA